MSLVNLKIGQRLAGAFSIIVLLLVVITGLGISRLSTLNGSAQLVIQDRYPKAMMASEMLDEANVIAIAMRSSVILDDPRTIEAELQKISAARAVIDKNLSQLELTLNTPTGQALFRAILDGREKYRVSQEAFLQLMTEGNKSAASSVLVASVMETQALYMERLEALTKFISGLITAEGAQAEQDYKTGVAVMLALAITAILLASGFAYRVTRGITTPLKKAVVLANAVASGDLSSRIDVVSRDETGQLMLALKNMNDSLMRIVGEVRGSADTIGVASSQIASGNLDLSARTDEQASSLAETASSMEQLTSTVKQNADNALQANQLAVSASQIAIRGGGAVAQLVSTMEMINKSSSEISDIVGVIDSIAFQTNILALNAAVEAARAGQEGRGFAVVAAEVRNLAQRSAEAAKEIKTLIDSSVSRANEGSTQAAEAGKTMDEIVDSVRRVTDIMGEIAAASQEQTAGIAQVNQAVGLMDSATQQNAALVEEAAAAAASLHDQTSTLSQLVGVFKLSSPSNVVRATGPATGIASRLFA